jgi:hypothetical protein
MWVKRKASNQRAGRMGVDEDAPSHWPTMSGALADENTLGVV